MRIHDRHETEQQEIILLCIFQSLLDAGVMEFTHPNLLVIAELITPKLGSLGIHKELFTEDGMPVIVQRMHPHGVGAIQGGVFSSNMSFAPDASALVNKKLKGWECELFSTDIKDLKPIVEAAVGAWHFASSKQGAPLPQTTV